MYAYCFVVHYDCCKPQNVSGVQRRLLAVFRLKSITQWYDWRLQLNADKKEIYVFYTCPTCRTLGISSFSDRHREQCGSLVTLVMIESHVLHYEWCLLPAKRDSHFTDSLWTFSQRSHTGLTIRGHTNISRANRPIVWGIGNVNTMGRLLPLLRLYGGVKEYQDRKRLEILADWTTSPSPPCSQARRF